MKIRLVFRLILFFFIMLMNQKIEAQNSSNYLRIANIIVDSASLENYITALKEGMESAIKLEPGVLTFYAVHDKEKPTHITVFEIYKNKEAYQFHINTTHFKKYKNLTLKMVKKLTLDDVEKIAFYDKK